MQTHNIIDVGECVIDVSADSQYSSVLDFTGWRSKLAALIFDGPADGTGTFRVQVSHSVEDYDEYGSTWRDLQSNGADVTIPTDGSVRINTSVKGRLRIASSAAEVLDRRFRVMGDDLT